MHNTRHRSVTEPPERVSFEEWFNEFNVSRLYRAKNMEHQVLLDETLKYTEEHTTPPTVTTENLFGKLLKIKNKIYGTSK